MKKFIKVVGIIAILGSVGVASTGSSDIVGVSENTVEDITSTNLRCDFLMRLMGMCRSSEILPKD